MDKPLKVVLAKPGLDGHNVGIKVIARALRDGGFDVVYLGLRVPTGQIVAAAIQEDADLIGVSNLSGSLSGFVKELQAGFSDAGIKIPIVVGGSLTPDEEERLRSMGVDGMFGPGSDTADIVKVARKLAQECAAAKQTVNAVGE